jgi:glycosyltransferase involved in cell wall biosynthesis
MIEHLERNGVECTMYLIDHHGWHLDQHRRTIASWWPGVRAEVRDVADGIDDAHAVIATCWQSAYPVLASPAAGVRMYFVQDFEPLFYPAGSLAMLAEATYGFGFRGITAGRWLSEVLRRDHGMVADPFDFGCDLEHYQLDDGPGAADRRTGVAYYCRPSTPRRAHELAVMAIELFAEQHPEVDIHFFGESVRGLRFPVTQHGMLTPQELGGLYNRCVAGLVLSATNVSLVPHEMLAAGCIPVVNDGEQNRLVLRNDEVCYADPSPFGLAAALSELVSAEPSLRAKRAVAAAESVTSTSWAAAGDQVLHAIRDAVEDAASAD